MLIQETHMTVPAGKTGALPIKIDLASLLIAEQRQDEIAMVTPIKAPELLALFNRAWRTADEYVTKLTREKIAGEREQEQRKSRLLLDEIPAILEAKKVKDSKDTRDAAIALDDQMVTITERVDELTAAVAYFKGKLRSFENAFTSVKKIMGEDMYSMQGRIGNKNLSGATRPEPPRADPPRPSSTAVEIASSINSDPSSHVTARVVPTSETPTAPTPARAGWGVPRYDKQ